MSDSTGGSSTISGAGAVQQDASSTIGGAAQGTDTVQSSVTGSDTAETTIDGAGSVGGAESVSSSGADTTGSSVGGAVAGTDSVSAAGTTATIAAAPAEPVVTQVAKAKPAAPAQVTKTAAAPAAVPAAPTAAEVAAQRQLASITELLGNYKAALSTRIVTAAMHRDAAIALSNVMIRILKDAQVAQFDLVWKFFTDPANASILIESVAMSGFEALAKEARGRTEIAYTLFRAAAAGKNVGDPKVMSTTVLANTLRCPKLVAYLSTKVTNPLTAS
jgi:hypothetical protein